jgi:hypothetical protein
MLSMFGLPDKLSSTVIKMSKQAPLRKIMSEHFIAFKTRYVQIFIIACSIIING